MKMDQHTVAVRHFCVIICFLVLIEPTLHKEVHHDFQVLLDGKGHYRVLADKQVWLQSSATFFTIEQKTYRSDDGSLQLHHISTDYGFDKLGPWNVTSLYYKPLGVKAKVKVMFRWYRDLPLVLFGQAFITSASGCSKKNRNGVISGFPSFKIEDAKSAGRDRELGYLAYGGIMAGDTGRHIGLWKNETFKAKSGLDSGPLVLFDKQNHSLIVCPFNNFMATSVQYARHNKSRTDQHQSHDQHMTASWGIMGNVNEVPKDYEIWTAMMYSSDGINKLMSQWGAIMRYYYNKPKSYRDSDLANNYLGYWTDNGAYYYYKTEPGLNYQDTILAVKKYADVNKIPYRYVQYDSWWYHKGVYQGVTEWSSMAKVFPRGLRYLWDKTGWPVVAHNRWWSNYTLYAKQNGGHYNFIVENKTAKAIPLDQIFWDDLLRESKKWGLITYEQDWLNVEFDGMDTTVRSLSLGDQWLHQMAEASQKLGLTLQYCMAPPRHTLTSLCQAIVTQVRVTIDYQPGEDVNWRIGVTNMFAAAVGLAPFKDNFWTTGNQPGNIYNKSEPYTELNSIVATLSTGPVGIGDRIGYSNRTLIMRSCNEEGLILKPSQPITAISKQLILAAYDDFRGEIWSTHSYISRLQFGIILGAAFTERISVSPTEAGSFIHQNMPVKAFSIHNPGKMVKFSDASPINLIDCSKTNFCVWYTTPVLNIGSQEVVILGELSKWVVMSPQRVTSIIMTTDDLQMTLAGAVSEKITMTFQISGILTDIQCIIGKSGSATLSLKDHQCVAM